MMGNTLYLITTILVLTFNAGCSTVATPAISNQPAATVTVMLTQMDQEITQLMATPLPETATPTTTPTATPIATVPLPPPSPTLTLTSSPSATPTLTMAAVTPTFPAPAANTGRASQKPEIEQPTPIPSPTDTATPEMVAPTRTPAVPLVATSAGQTAPISAPPLTRTVRIGLNGRNDIGFHELDYQLIRETGIETLKMMSLTSPAVFARIKQENPDIEMIVRFYDDRINANGHPTPAEFAARMIPIMQALQPYAAKFEVGNEPNHFKRYEGWGPEDADAENFNDWFLEVYTLLKAAHPWAELGFPALGTPDSIHRDRAWLALNREAIGRADWLGVHCYWQTPPDGSSTMFDEAHGLCFKYYHAIFPDKPLELTEFDNDNIFYDFPLDTEEEIAQQHLAYFQELFKYPYLRSASSYIMSSPDRTWEYFVWRTEDGRFKPVVGEVATMARPTLVE